MGGRWGKGRIVTEGIGGSSGWAGWAWVGKVVSKSLEPGNVVSKPGGKVGFVGVDEVSMAGMEHW